MTTGIWNDAALVKVLTELAEIGLSAGAIATELGSQGYRVSRNAVIGKLRRLGIALKNSGANAARSHRPKRPKRPKCVAAPQMLAVAPPADEAGAMDRRAPKPIERRETMSRQPISINDLTKDVCHWPLGGFADLPPFMYCGDPVLEGCPYCARHFALSTVEHKETTYVATKPVGAAA